MQNNTYDAVIAGGGPAGNVAANQLAAQGYDVCVLESDSYVGETRQSTGGTFSPMMASFGINHDEAVMNHTSKVVFEGKDEKLVHDFPGFVLDFGNFKKYQADRARENGAEYRLDRRVTGLERELEEGDPEEELGVVCNVLDGGGDTETVRGNVVIDATGASATLGKDAGLVEYETGEVGLGVEYEMEGVEMEVPGSMVLKVDYDYAPGGYAWIFDTGNGTAKVGVCGFNAYKQHHEGENMTWEERFEKFWNEDPRLENAEKVKKDGEYERHAGQAFITNIPRKVDENLILAGDTVSSIDPVWGEGIENCMISGREAAVATTHALEAEDYSRETLSRYEDRWESQLDNKEQRLKLAHLLYGLDDETVDKAIRSINQLSEEELQRLNQNADRKVIAKMLLRDPQLLWSAGRDLWKTRDIRK